MKEEDYLNEAYRRFRDAYFAADEGKLLPAVRLLACGLEKLTKAALVQYEDTNEKL